MRHIRMWPHISKEPPSLRPLPHTLPSPLPLPHNHSHSIFRPPRFPCPTRQQLRKATPRTQAVCNDAVSLSQGTRSDLRAVRGYDRWRRQTCREGVAGGLPLPGQQLRPAVGASRPPQQRRRRRPPRRQPRARPRRQPPPPRPSPLTWRLPAARPTCPAPPGPARRPPAHRRFFVYVDQPAYVA